MEDKVQPQVPTEQGWEYVVRRLPPIAAFLVGAVFGVAFEVVWVVLFLLAVCLIVFVFGRIIPLRDAALGYSIFALAMLGSLVVNARFHRHLRRVSRVLSIGFGVFTILTALVVSFFGVGFISFAQIAPD